MHHPLYYHAMRYVGRPIYVYHQNGYVYHGTLSMVSRSGIYVLNCRPIGHPVNYQSDSSKSVTDLLDVTHNEEAKGSLIYVPGAYFAFGALTGLTLGALAGYW